MLETLVKAYFRGVITEEEAIERLVADGWDKEEATHAFQAAIQAG